MYRNMRLRYWCPCMKRKIALYVERCLTCRIVKDEHQRPHGKLQKLEDATTIWEQNTMDFITQLPQTAKGFDAIWVIGDRLTKNAQFLSIRERSLAEKLVDLYMHEIVAWHGIPISIVSDRDVRFTYRFWQTFHEELGTRLHLSIIYHPQTVGHSERTVQRLEDMLRACLIDFCGSWDFYLPLSEFSYDDNYHSSIGALSFELIYVRKFCTLVC